MDRLLAYPLICLLWLINHLPFSTQITVGRIVGVALYYFIRRRRHIAEVNVALCFAELSKKDQQKLVREIFKNNGIGLIEAAMSWWSDPEEFKHRVSIEGREYLDHALAEQKGVILLGAHYSTLDLGGLLFTRYYPLSCMYRPNNNSLFEQVITKGRLRYLDNLIPKSDFRAVIKLLRQNKIIWYSPDQDMGRENSVFVPFFGKEAATTTATARLARISGAPVILISHHREGDKYIIRLHPQINSFDFDDEVACAVRVNEELEKGIRYDVSQYMWVHRRFKTRRYLSEESFYEKQGH